MSVPIVPPLPPSGSMDWYDHYKQMDLALRYEQESARVVRITVSDYDDLVAAGTVSAETVYVVVPDPTPPAFSWLIRDDFASTESPPATTDTGQAWRVETGTWSQASGSLSASADGAIIVVDAGSNTQTAEYVIGGTLPASGNPTLALRYDNSNEWHYRLVKVNTSELRLERRNPGSTTIFQTATGVVAAGSRVRVAVTGTVGAVTFRLWVGGVEITTVASGSFTDTSSQPPVGTEVGFRYGFSSSGNQYGYREFKAHNAVVTP